MKKTRLVEMLRGFRQQRVIFISIVLFVGFGMGAFLGLTWSSDSMIKTVDGYYTDGKWADLEVTYAYGLSEEDVDFLAGLQGIDSVEGRYEDYRFLEKDGNRFQIRIVSLTDSHNLPTWLSGTLPEKADEIAVEQSFAQKNNIQIGEEISLDPSGNHNIFQAGLTGQRFRVTGVMKTAEYLSTYADTYGVDPGTGCPVNGIMFVSKAAFSAENGEGFSGVLAGFGHGEEPSYFSPAYRDQLKEIQSGTKAALDEHFSKKYEDLSRLPGLSTAENYGYGFTLSTANASYVGVDTLVKVFGELRYSLCGLFVIVGILVCFFAVSRNVYEQTKLLGTKKALGFFNREIRASLMLFSALSTVTGIVAGILGARYLVASALVEAMKESYAYNQSLFAVDVPQALGFGAAELVIMLSTTALASRTILKRSANSLLTGAKEAACSHRRYMDTKLYQRLSEFRKTIVNNLFSDPKRVCATVVGIMGITALVVSSVSLNDFIQDSFLRNAEEITKYDTVIYLRQESEDAEKIRGDLAEKGMDSATIMSTYVTLNTPDDQHIAVSLYVVEDNESFLSLFDLHSGADHAELLDGLYSSVSYREEYHPGPEDAVMLTDALGQEHAFRHVTFFDYYLIQNQFIIDKKTYEDTFGNEYGANTILCQRGDNSFETLKEDLSGYDGIVSISDYYATSKESFDSFAAIFVLVVGVYILLAILMALVVVMNLIVMFIREKKREIIILMINGFERRDAKRYIYLDTIFLTIIGMIFGLILGVLMGNLSLAAYRTASIYFEGGIDWKACLAGMGITAALSFLVSVFSLRTVDSLTLSDINKL